MRVYQLPYWLSAFESTETVSIRRPLHHVSLYHTATYECKGRFKQLFRQAWQYYVTATELNKKSKEVQAVALCSVMSLECVKVVISLTTLTVEDKSDPEKILTALIRQPFHAPRKHLLLERVKFGLPIKLNMKLLTSML